MIFSLQNSKLVYNLNHFHLILCRVHELSTWPCLHPKIIKIIFNLTWILLIYLKSTSIELFKKLRLYSWRVLTYTPCICDCHSHTPLLSLMQNMDSTLHARLFQYLLRSLYKLSRSHINTVPNKDCPVRVNSILLLMQPSTWIWRSIDLALLDTSIQTIRSRISASLWVAIAGGAT